MLALTGFSIWHKTIDIPYKWAHVSLCVHIWTKEVQQLRNFFDILKVVLFRTRRHQLRQPT